MRVRLLSHRFALLGCEFRLLVADAPEQLVDDGRLAAVPVRPEEGRLAERPLTATVAPGQAVHDKGAPFDGSKAEGAATVVVLEVPREEG